MLARQARFARLWDRFEKRPVHNRTGDYRLDQYFLGQLVTIFLKLVYNRGVVFISYTTYDQGCKRSTVRCAGWFQYVKEENLQ